MVELFDAAREAGLKVAVCSASTKIAVQYALQNVLGEARFSSLDAFLAGDDVAQKKPNPAIYKVGGLGGKSASYTAGIGSEA